MLLLNLQEEVPQQENLPIDQEQQLAQVVPTEALEEAQEVAVVMEVDQEVVVPVAAAEEAAYNLSKFS